MPTKEVLIGAKYEHDETGKRMVCVKGSTPKQDDEIVMWDRFPAEGFREMWQGSWKEFMDEWTLTGQANILVVGDSWASAHEADTGNVDAGWPEIMGVPENLRQAVAGSTAEQWAQNFDGRLDKARETKTSKAFVSLMGNDARRAISDGKITADEMARALTSMREVILAVEWNRDKTFVLLYTDPYSGKDPKAAMGVQMLNGAIRAACHGLDVEFYDTSRVLKPEHFDGKDIHPTRAGHEVLAADIKGIV